jgi:hypothetical protein
VKNFKLAVAVWLAGASALLLSDNHRCHISMGDILTWGAYTLIAASAAAFVAMLVCCLYTDYRVIKSERLP